MNLTFSFKTRQLYLYFIISSRFCLVQKSCNFDMMLEIITVKNCLLLNNGKVSKEFFLKAVQFGCSHVTAQRVALAKQQFSPSALCKVFCAGKQWQAFMFKMEIIVLMELLQMWNKMEIIKYIVSCLKKNTGGEIYCLARTTPWPWPVHVYLSYQISLENNPLRRQYSHCWSCKPQSHVCSCMPPVFLSRLRTSLGPALSRSMEKRW